MTDLGLLMKYIENPDTYSTMENISFIHYFLLHSNGEELAVIKILISASLFAFWTRRFIYPDQVTVLKYATFIYSFIWVLIGLLVLTGISGTLQYAAGIPIQLFDLSPLVTTMPISTLSVLISVVIGIPVFLVLIPKLNNIYS